MIARRIEGWRILANLVDDGQRSFGDGAGVAEAALARLGEPFARIDLSRDRATGGFEVPLRYPLEYENMRRNFDQSLDR